MFKISFPDNESLRKKKEERKESKQDLAHRRTLESILRHSSICPAIVALESSEASVAIVKKNNDSLLRVRLDNRLWFYRGFFSRRSKNHFHRRLFTLSYETFHAIS
jgi:hypothetical protein